MYVEWKIRTKLAIPGEITIWSAVMTVQPSAESLKQTLRDKGVKYALAGYVDIHGIIKGKFVPVDHLDRMLKGSELFTGAALDGVPQGLC